MLLKSISLSEYRQKKYKNFYFFFTISTLIPLCLVAVINLVIDPYLYFYSPTFKKINSITTESIGDRMDNYIDNSHYSPQAGDLVLNRILSFQTEKIPEDFGILVTSDNIESHLEQIRLAKEVWRKEHPEEVNLVKKIKAGINN